MQTMIKQQKEDFIKGMFYRTGYSVNHHIPKAVEAIEANLRSTGKATCPLFGCHGKAHKSNSSRNCFYYGHDVNDEILYHPFNI